MFNDLRDYIREVERLGEYKVIEGADWDLEIGALTEYQVTIPHSPLLIFDAVKGYPKGYRVVSNVLNTARRVNLALGLPIETEGLEQVKAWRSKTKEGIKLIPPRLVKTGPVKDRIDFEDKVDLLKFPTPKWHELDGGRYIGTGCVIVQKDPDEGWVNLGTYRVQVHDKNTATIHIVDGHHGDLIRKKYWNKGLVAPAVVVCGEDPLLFYVASGPIPWGVSEYDYTGGLRNEPIEVVEGELTNLPIPASAEIALEGEIVLPDSETRMEGPFGEWQGYYAGKPKPEPIFRVKAVYHRENPILFGAPPTVGAFDNRSGRYVTASGDLWNELERQVSGVKGVWMPPEARNPMMVIISVKQMYSGHAQQAAMVAAGWYGTACNNRFIILVDDDIDPSQIGEVLWALTTRCDPEESIDILRGCWTMPSDPILSPENKRIGRRVTSRAIIYACKPYHWIKDFPPSVKSSPEILARIKEKYLL